MLHGNGYHVTHPRRKDQDFVSCSIEHVAKSIEQSIGLGWSFRVAVVRYVGDDALGVNVGLVRVWDALSDAARQWCAIDNGEIVGAPQKK